MAAGWFQLGVQEYLKGAQAAREEGLSSGQAYLNPFASLTRSPIHRMLSSGAPIPSIKSLGIKGNVGKGTDWSGIPGPGNLPFLGQFTRSMGGAGPTPRNFMEGLMQAWAPPRMPSMGGFGGGG